MRDKDGTSASGDDDLREAELEVLRIRLLLGMDVSDAPLEERILARTLNRIDDDSRAPARAPVEVFARRRRRWPHMSVKWVAAACLMLLVVLTVTMWPSTPAFAFPPGLQYSTHPANVSSAPDARPVLMELADAARAARAPGAGAVQYIESFGWGMAVDGDLGRAAIVPTEWRLWLADDGSGLAIERQSSALLPDGNLDPSPVYSAIDEATDEFPPGSIDSAMSAFSRNPDELKTQFLDQAPPECQAEARHADCLLSAIAAQTIFRMVPSELNGAFWEMLADVPGVHFLGETSDRIGRTVVAVAALPVETPFETTVLVLLVDPETGSVVGEERVSLESTLVDIDGPSVTNFTTRTDARMVSEVGES